MTHDIVFALRQLRKNPGFAAIAVLTLGVGIGTASAMFGLIHGALLSPPPYTDPDRVVLISTSRMDGQRYTRGITVGQWKAWRGAHSFEPAMYGWTFNFLVRPDGSQSMAGMIVTPSYFSVLGLKPVLGRTFVDAELGRDPDKPATAVILGYDAWRRKFGGDPDIIGRTIQISRMPPLPVVGVMPPGIRFLPDPGASSEPNYDLNAPVDFWLGRTVDETRPTSGAGHTVARLRPGATPQEAQAEIAALAPGLASADPRLAGVSAAVTPVQEALNREGRRLLVPLFGSVALVFLIACANVTGLLLTRGLQRHPEYAVRSALGAGRARLFRQALSESLLLALLGAALGAGLASGFLALLKAIAGNAVPRADAVHVGWPVFAFAFLIAFVAAGVAGALPAVRASFPDRFQGLKGGRTTASRGERRLVGAVAALQIVLTVALLAGAGLLIRTARNLDRMHPGYVTENVLLMTVTSMARERSADFHKLALERVASVPGVARAAFAWGVPLTGNKWNGDLVFPRASSTPDQRISVPLRSITQDYFDVMGMTLADGRPFRESDGPDAPRVAIVNAALAKRYYPGRSPVGEVLPLQGGPSDKPLTIVGLLADTRTESLSAAAEPEVYLPFWQSSAFSKHLVVRATGDPVALASLVRAEMRTIDPTLAVERITTMDAVRRASVAPRTFAMRLLVGFAAVATSLALVGLYGVLSLSVHSRVKEIAVRKAVGAQHLEIVQLVVGEASKLVAAGLLAGTVAALLVGRLLQALLFDVSPWDPLSLAIAALVFGLVAAGACLAPAYRASRVDLMESLRQE